MFTAQSGDRTLSFLFLSFFFSPVLFRSTLFSRLSSSCRLCVFGLRDFPFPLHTDRKRVRLHVCIARQQDSKQARQHLAHLAPLTFHSPASICTVTTTTTTAISKDLILDLNCSHQQSKQQQPVTTKKTTTSKFHVADECLCTQH